MPVTGHTRLFGIVADPIAQVRTPQVLNAHFERQGFDGILVPFHVAPPDLPAFVAAMRAMRNLGGFIVTVPHKTAMLELVDRVEDAGRLTGAINTVRREADGTLTGTMFDGVGFVAGLRAEGLDPRGRRVCMAGAGGAANAIAFALAEAGVARLTIANRTAAKAEELAARVRAACPGVAVAAGPAVAAGHDMLVNATSLGLADGDALPFDVSTLTAGTVVAEIIMKPARTPLLAAAEARGCPTHYGRHMLDHQVRLMADFLIGGS